VVLLFFSFKHHLRRISIFTMTADRAKKSYGETVPLHSLARQRRPRYTIVIGSVLEDSP